uniref:Reverse transcriptase domain-containing protein n=1 Tax=Cannabis sativa TaxID=3483 RepID=A0A803PQV1_CANSA
MTTIITSYFQELFTASTIDASSLNHTIDTIPTTVTAAMNLQLTKPFTPDEIYQALKTMSPDKSPGRKSSPALKLDMSKAFDRVEWSYIEAVMAKLGFDARWISLIMKCLSSTSFSFSLNSDIVGNVIPSRGLRQRNPLSPYLFLICSEGVDRLIWHYTTAGVYTVKSGFHLATDLEDAACSLCSQAWESIGHDLFQCSHAKYVWRHFNFPIDFNKTRNMVGGDYIFHLATLLSQQELELFFVIIWVIWTDRNKINHGESRRDGLALANYATNYMGNYQKAKNHPTAVSEPTVPTSTITLPLEGIPWKPPDMLGLKLNVDAAVNPISKVLGVGAIVRNHNGEVIAAISKPV